MSVFLASVAVITVAAFVVGFFYGRKRRIQWKQSINLAVNDCMKIEAFSGHSVDECYSRIIARFKELGFELKAIEGNDLEFILHSRGFLRRSWGVIDIVLGTFAAGPLVPALLIGDYFGSRRVGNLSRRPKQRSRHSA